MSISYGSVGGIGSELTEEIVQKLIAANIFTEEEWEDDYYECLECVEEKLGISSDTSGNFYSDRDITHYLLVSGSNLKEIIENCPTFLEKMKSVDVELSVEDLIVISDYKVM
jgi:hypothetical protein